MYPLVIWQFAMEAMYHRTWNIMFLLLKVFFPVFYFKLPEGMYFDMYALMH